MAENPFFYPLRRDTELPPPPNRFVSCRILGKPVPLAYVYQSRPNDPLLFVLQDLKVGSMPRDSGYPLGFKHSWAIYKDSDTDVTDVTVLEPVCGSATAEEAIAASKGQPVCSHPGISLPKPMF